MASLDLDPNQPPAGPSPRRNRNRNAGAYVVFAGREHGLYTNWLVHRGLQ